MTEALENSGMAAESPGGVPGEQKVRFLTGWMNEPQALQVLGAGQYGPGPYPAPLELQVRATEAREAVVEREPFEPKSAILPHAEDDAAFNEAAGRAEIGLAFRGTPWRVEYVDLAKVIAIQNSIVVDGLHDRVAGITEGSRELLEVCLPTQQQPVAIDMAPEPGAVCISSLNPNLRCQGYQVARDGSAVTFIIGFGLPYLQVVEIEGRFFLRDGHHRAVGLLAEGVTAAPAVVVAGTSYAELGAAPGLFAQQVVFGERPPMLADFLDERVSDVRGRRAPRKITRISAADFAV